MRKPHYVPAAELPIEFFLKRYARIFATINGFTFIHVDRYRGLPVVYIHRGTRTWRKT